jgi:hypothetical protein
MVMGTFLLLFKAFMIHDAQAEAGMIPFDSPIGEIGGRGHWYSLRTMKGADYWDDPAITSDIRKNDDGTYSIMGEAPISVALVLHPGFYDGREPWRRAIDWLRQAEQMFRNSGVPVRFIIEEIITWEDMPSGVEAGYRQLPFAPLKSESADLVLGLTPHYFGDGYCGIAGLGGTYSVSSCSPVTFAHEIGHNLGLVHAHDVRYDGRKGYCISPSPEARDCDYGTIMSYGRTRVPLFAADGFTFDGDALGNEDRTAVEYLRKAVVTKALAYERRTQARTAAKPAPVEVIID